MIYALPVNIAVALSDFSSSQYTLHDRNSIVRAEIIDRLIISLNGASCIQYMARDGNSSLRAEIICCHGRPTVSSPLYMCNAKNLQLAGHCSIQFDVSDSIEVFSPRIQSGTSH